MRRLRYSLYAGLAVGGEPEQSIPPPREPAPHDEPVVTKPRNSSRLIAGGRRRPTPAASRNDPAVRDVRTRRVPALYPSDGLAFTPPKRGRIRRPAFGRLVLRPSTRASGWGVRHDRADKDIASALDAAARMRHPEVSREDRARRHLS